MATQLEFNIEDKSLEEMKFYYMQKQIDAMVDSMGKVRRKLFSEMTEFKKIFYELKKENEELKSQLNILNNKKTEWSYSQNGNLFELKEYKEAAC